MSNSQSRAVREVVYAAVVCGDGAKDVLASVSYRADDAIDRAADLGCAVVAFAEPDERREDQSVMDFAVVAVWPTAADARACLERGS